jgi:ribonuclease R
MPTEVRDADRADRTDLRDVPFTDHRPETARDFDDAVAIESLPNGGSRLWVAVADVSHYVREGSPLTPRRCAAAAASTSRTAPSRCCPSRSRRTSARWCRSRTGWRWWCASISTGSEAGRQRVLLGGDSFAARLDYPGVRRALAATRAASGASIEPFLPDLRAMDSIGASVCACARIGAGALDFDLPSRSSRLDHDDPPAWCASIRKSRAIRRATGVIR